MAAKIRLIERLKAATLTLTYPLIALQAKGVRSLQRLKGATLTSTLPLSNGKTFTLTRLLGSTLNSTISLLAVKVREVIRLPGSSYINMEPLKGTVRTVIRVSNAFFYDTKVSLQGASARLIARIIASTIKFKAKTGATPILIVEHRNRFIIESVIKKAFIVDNGSQSITVEKHNRTEEIANP